ncbi:ubiquitin thioesterase OTU1-like [Lytechinus pictus]|uniref:ubiquitin thioesterase OTU1-like n=1 Tax=Lytechinus pictus TaxID=7653 RepID=UPI00240DC5B8|nr:ubiquitin thioesterase OTU1-like [Lytechinus pictus]
MTSPPFLVMVKAKNGRTKLEGLTMKSTISNLLQKISEFTEIPSKSQKLLHGYPPKPLDISNHGQELASLPFKSGDMVIVEEVVISNQTDGTRGSSDAEATMTRRVVPADNSCLFMGIALLMEGGNTDSSRAQELRNLIVSVVSSNPELYNEAFLGKSNSMYCQWIKNPDSWGGAIEISILTEFYETEIAVVDTQTVRVDKFGENNGYKHRIYLIYDNVHYDPLIKELEGGGTETVFGVDDEDVLSQVLKLATEAQKSRQYTDLSGFTLRCLVCNDGLRGQRQAQQHAIATGHSNFAEY